uniref:Uncharacterized protein n=1 Tax=Panagrolaimus sp. JU765 TaxID=591449 RepID=A0AC34R7I9_9BILA
MLKIPRIQFFVLYFSSLLAVKADDFYVHDPDYCLKTVFDIPEITGVVVQSFVAIQKNCFTDDFSGLFSVNSLQVSYKKQDEESFFIKLVENMKDSNRLIQRNGTIQENSTEFRDVFPLEEDYVGFWMDVSRYRVGVG